MPQPRAVQRVFPEVGERCYRWHSRWCDRVKRLESAHRIDPIYLHCICWFDQGHDNDMLVTDGKYVQEKISDKNIMNILKITSMI